MQISIIGGGITGLTTALALQQLGIPSRIFERAAQLNEVGAGITMAPNALKVFDWLGIGDQIRKNGIPIQSAVITNTKMKPLRTPKKEFLTDANTGDAIIAIHRAKLQEILYQNLPAQQMHLAMPYTGHEIKEDKIYINFGDKIEIADVLLGADGIHSPVRRQVFGEMPLRYSGQTCWRGVAEISNAPDLKMAEAWGRKKRFGFAAISPNKVYWFAVSNSPQGEKDEAGMVKTKLASMFQEFSQPVAQLLAATPEDKIIRSDISDLQRLATWHQGAVCLLGDAAHATTPNMGQGGAQGVEDAYYIAHLLAKNTDCQKAFAEFETLRRPKVDYIVNNSWRFGQMSHSPFMQPILKFILGWMPEKMLEKQMQTVFELKKI